MKTLAKIIKRLISQQPTKDGFVKIYHDEWIACPAETYDIILKDGSMLMYCRLWAFTFTHLSTYHKYEFRDAEYWRLSQ